MENTNLNTEATENTTTTPEVKNMGENTQPQAVTVDMEAINKAAEARAERAAQAAVRNMLQQQGLDDSAIGEIVSEWKAKQRTPEQILQEKESTISTLQQQLEAVEQEKTALAKGIPLGSTDDITREKANACIALAKTYVSEEMDFASALERAKALMGGFETQPVQTEPQGTPMPQAVAPTQNATQTDEIMEKIMRNLR